MNRYVPPRRSAFVAARPSGFVNPLDPLGLLTGGPFGPPSLTSAPVVEGWGAGPGPGSAPSGPPNTTQPVIPPSVPAPQQPPMPTTQGATSAPRPTVAPASPAPIAAPADTGLSASTMLLGVLALGGIAGAAYYFKKKGRR